MKAFSAPPIVWNEMLIFRTQQQDKTILNEKVEHRA